MSSIGGRLVDSAGNTSHRALSAPFHLVCAYMGACLRCPLHQRPSRLSSWLCKHPFPPPRQTRSLRY